MPWIKMSARKSRVNIVSASARADEDIECSRKKLLNVVGNAVVKHGKSAGIFLNDESLPRLPKLVNPERELEAVGTLREVRHRMVRIFYSLAPAVGPQVRVVNGDPLIGIVDPATNEGLPNLPAAKETRRNMMHVDIHRGFKLCARPRKPSRIGHAVPVRLKPGEKKSERVRVSVRIRGEFRIPFFESGTVRRGQSFGGDRRRDRPCNERTHPLIAILFGNMEAEFVHNIVINKQIEGDGTCAMREFIGGKNLGPNAGVIKLELVAREDPRFVEGIGRRRHRACLGRPILRGGEKMCARFLL